MKKLLLFVSISLLTVASANAQCTPDPQYTSPGIYPNQATGFSAGCLNQAYSQLVTNVVPADTLVEVVPGFPISVPIDSIVIVSFTGLPPGLSVVYYDGQNTNSPFDLGAYEGGTIGCALISGTPTSAGIFDLTINVNAYVGGVPTANAQLIDWYSIEITTCTASINENEFSNFSVYPNPAQTSISVDGLNGANFEAVVITNLNGAIVKEIRSISTSNQTIDVSDLENGIYLIQVETASSKEVIRFVKK